jgi:Protein of unknown function (DUF2971)
MDDSIQIAGQAGISSLYHYQDFQPGLHADRLVDILRNHRIYCSNPADFNDPWDCKPYFDPALLNDPANHAATAESLIATQRGGPKGNTTDHLLRTNPAFLKNAIHRFSEFQADFITKRWGVYCLSPDPCLTLMWSHYSRNHRGICLEFALDSSKVRAAQKVRYQKGYPPLLLHESESRLNMLLIKSDVWAYEQEFRLICPRYRDMENHPLMMDGNYLSLGAHDLKSVIVGCQADDVTTKALKTLVEEHAPTVAFRQAKRTPNKYRLVIESELLAGR